MVKVASKKRTSIVCASYYGLFKVRPESKTASGLYYAVMWNGNITKARCTCPGGNFVKHCKHLDKVDERGCFWAGGAPESPTFSQRVASKKGGVLSPIGFAYDINEPVSSRPMVAKTSCPNCDGPTVIVTGSLKRI